MSPLSSGSRVRLKIHKITKGFFYLVAAGPFSPPTTEPPDPIKSVLLNEHARLIVESANSPRPLSKVSQHWARRIEKRNAIKDAHRADNQAIDDAITQNRAITEAMLDSGATRNFIQSADGFELTGALSKTVSAANGQIMRATMTALLPLTQLRAGAHKAIIIPESKQALISIKQLADQGFTTIFHPHLEGVTVHDNDGFKLVTSKPPLLQEWREKGG